MVLSAPTIVPRSGREVFLGLMVSTQYPVDEGPVERFSEQIDQVRFARDHGFDGVFATQHYLAYPFQYLHPLATLARLIPETGDMRIGTGISLAALAHPVDLAEQLATIDIMSDGRLSVGVGLGYRDLEFAAFGLGKKGRLKRYLDNIDLMRQLWTFDRVSSELDNALLDAAAELLTGALRGAAYQALLDPDTVDIFEALDDIDQMIDAMVMEPARKRRRRQ